MIDSTSHNCTLSAKRTALKNRLGGTTPEKQGVSITPLSLRKSGTPFYSFRKSPDTSARTLCHSKFPRTFPT